MDSERGLMKTVTYDDIEKEAREEWTANLDMGYIQMPMGWDRKSFIDHLAYRTIYIFRAVGEDLEDTE